MGPESGLAAGRWCLFHAGGGVAGVTGSGLKDSLLRILGVRTEACIHKAKHEYLSLPLIISIKRGP